ncbi:hypothetical protein TrCOL_g2008 [Triparma columacea]|uniref:Uncharacterized protein n=1 Tax=Triparma columacea TaxID=722753 RepID=A0A9W7GCD5_9STRA|nr:hypothetical protein TrCOL_g2008 [Triparma columacea]
MASGNLTPNITASFASLRSDLRSLDDLDSAKTKLDAFEGMVVEVVEENRLLREEIRLLKEENRKLKAGDSLPVEVPQDNDEEITPAIVPSEEDREVEVKLRRASLAIGEPLYDTSGKSLPGFLKTKAISDVIATIDLAALAESYVDTIKMSSGAIQREMENWFDANFLTWREESGSLNVKKNVRAFVVELAIKLRPMVKMFRIGLGMRLFTVAASSYVDMATDVLVTIAFFRTAGQEGWGMASLTCVSAGIGFQALFAWLQYRGLGFRKWGPMVLSALFGVLPVIEAWSVFRGAEQAEGMMFDPLMMLAITKGSEIVFESLPESIIQAISMLSSNLEDLSLINYFGITSSIVATGMIWTDANVGLARSLFVGAPKNPVYNWLPIDKTAFKKCFGGFFLSTMTFFTCNVFAIALVFLKFGGSFILYGILTEMAAVMLFKHFADGELFAFSVAAKPSKVHYVLGPVMTFGYYMVTFVGMNTQSKAPCELGPHINATLIIWRMITSLILVVLTLPSLVNDGTLPWLSVTGGMGLHFSCLVLSWVGAAMFFGNMAEHCERWRWWRRQTGRQHTEERWDAKEIWNGLETKDEAMARWFMVIHPLYFPMDRIKSWICNDLISKYGLANDDTENDKNEDITPPPFLTSDFHDRMIIIFNWWGNEDALTSVRTALSSLPTFTPPVITSQSSKISKQRSNTGKVAPEAIHGQDSDRLENHKNEPK